MYIQPDPVEEPPILDNEDEEILDRIWNDIGKEQTEEE